MKRLMLATVMAAGCAGGALAADLNTLKADGFFVWETTSIKGDFNGCERGQTVALDNGLTFVCAGTGYTHAHNPKVILLKNSHGAGLKMLVNGAEFDGDVHSS
jgi:hypothetical protein